MSTPFQVNIRFSRMNQNNLVLRKDERIMNSMGNCLVVTLAALVLATTVHAETLQEESQKEYEFLDERIVEHTFLLDRKVTPLTKYSGNPIIESTNGPAGVVKDKGGLIRMWYTGREPIPGEPPHGGRIPLGERTLRYAESTDGLNWKFPELGLVEFRGKKNHNILIKKESVDKNGKPLSHGERGFALPCVALTDKTPSAKGRYALFSRDNRGFSYSDDGLTWTAYEESPSLPTGGSDTYNNFFYDKRIKKYVLHHRPHRYFLAGYSRANRLVARIESADLLHWDWETARCVLNTDERDGPAVPRHTSDVYKSRGRDRQIERMTVTPYGSMYLGFAGVFDNRDKGLYSTYLVHSHDGINWIREPSGEPFIPHGKFGTWDSGIVGAVSAGCPICVDDKLLFYYMGSNMSHGYQMMDNRKLESRNIGAGYILKGRFVGYRADKVRGGLLTRPFLFAGKQLTLNANASQGAIKVAIAYANGTPVKGYGKDDFIVVSGDELELPLKWKGKEHLAELSDKRIRLRIEVDNGTVYGFKMK